MLQCRGFLVKVIGVGGAGSNVLDQIALDGMEEAELICMNTDVRTLKTSTAHAKVQIGKSGRFVGQEAVQLHGGMGMTEELNVGHFFKRLTMIDTQFGNVDHHLKRFAGA